MNNYSLVWSVMGLIVWGGGLFAVLQVGTGHEHLGHAHSICGPWGCGPPVAALVGWHGFWLLLVGPIVGLLIRSWPPGRLLVVGLMLLLSGVVALIGIGICEAVTWLPLVTSDQQTYFLKRFLFSVVTSTDIPVFPVTLAGIVMCLSARFKKVTHGVRRHDAIRLDEKRPMSNDRRDVIRRPCALVDANLSGANLSRTNLCGADLRLVKGLTQEQLDQAIIDERTQVPDYLQKTEE